MIGVPGLLLAFALSGIADGAVERPPVQTPHNARIADGGVERPPVQAPHNARIVDGGVERPQVQTPHNARIADGGVVSLPAQTLVFYNARIALREDRPTEVLRLWLLHNVLLRRGEPGLHDEAFRSVIWAALGKLGFCQDGFPKDDFDEGGGAGLWPLALHNWVLDAASKGPPFDRPAPFDAFDVAVQQRFISLNDVLSSDELRSVSFSRTKCLLPNVTSAELGGSPFVDLADRLQMGRLLRALLEVSITELVRSRVQNTAAIEARIFDLDLALVELQAREARRAGADAKAAARSAGVSLQGAEDIRKKAAAWPADSPQALFLRKTLSWTPSEWLTLSPPRRLFLFAQVRSVSDDPKVLERLILSIIDGLIARGEGEEIAAWIGFLGATTPERAGVYSGDRGLRLLGLDPTAGFRERAPLALHRGVAFLQEGDLREALRSFAYAMQNAEASREANTTLALARRWLSFVLARYQANEETISTLRALVPPQEYNVVIEDLVWSAALRADSKSFALLTENVKRGGAFLTRIARLRPLAEGKQGDFATQIRAALMEEPNLTVRFLRLLVEKLEAEDADVRAAQTQTMKHLIEQLQPLISTGMTANAQSRTAEELVRRLRAMLDALDELDTTAPGQARALSPRYETFAGSIRLAPSDPLPWPFSVPELRAPSAFAPLKLIPVEWRDSEGALVFGWRITE